MSIIDHTYFFGKLSLPQTGNTEGRSIVQQFIDQYEPEYLKRAMGYELWKAFTDGIESSGETPADERWRDLTDGAEFEYNDRTYKWNGFDPVDKLSPIANYVYYRYMEDRASANTLVGTVVQNVDNNTRVNALRKMVDAWNDMVEMNKLLYYFLQVNAATYPEYVEPDPVYVNEIFYPINEFGI